MGAGTVRGRNAWMGAARRWAAALCLAGLALGLPGLPARAVEGGAQLVPAEAGAGLSLPCRAAVLVDQGTGTVLYEKDADRQMPIASITKVMTLLLTFEALHNGQLTLDTPVPVSEHAASMGAARSGWSRGSTLPWTKCCGPSACPAPTTPPWRWPSWWGAARRPLWPG